MSGFSTSHLEYLQRTTINLSALRPASVDAAGTPNVRCLWRVCGVGRLDKVLSSVSLPRVLRPTKDLLIGIFGHKIPVAFVVRGCTDEVAIHLGTWSPLGRGRVSADTLEQRHRILGAALRSLYSAVDLIREDVEFKGM